MRRRGALLGLASLLAGLAGCAGGPAHREAFGLGRVEDPSFGLPKYAEFRHATPIEETAVYQGWTQAADPRRVPEELKPGVPNEAGMEAHPAWRADFPVERTPARRRFFLSGFVAGFAARLAYGAWQGSSSGGLGAGAFGSALLLGSATGLLAWTYSFRLPPATLQPHLTEDVLPSVEQTGVYREWSSPAK